MEGIRTADRRGSQLGLVTIGACGAYAASLVALHVLRPDVIRVYGDAVSAYSVGRHGWLGIAGFIVLAVGAFALAAGLFRRFRGRLAAAGAVFVALFGSAGSSRASSRSRRRRRSFSP